jgi:hypothetical protein
VYKLFPRGQNSPIDYKGDITADDLTRFVKEQAGRSTGACGATVVSCEPQQPGCFWLAVVGRYAQASMWA